MVFTGGGPHIEQQITLSSQIGGENNLAFSNYIQMPCHDRAEQKAIEDPDPVKWAGMEFYQNHGGLASCQALPHSVQKHQGGCGGHYHGQTGCSIDPGSTHYGSRPVVCWLGCLPTSVPFNHLLLGPPLGDIDYTPSFFKTCLFPNQHSSTAVQTRCSGM
jgi:hypothetical protein